MPPTVIEPLSWVAQNKTGGLILFVTNFLQSLHKERLIYFNPTTLRWEFDLIKIAQKELPVDIVKFLREKIMCLPKEVQAGLNIAACLGSTFDLAVLQKAHRSPDNVVEDSLTLAVENEFVQELAPTHFTWSHDQLQEAAYLVIPMNKQETMHMLIGAIESISIQIEMKF